MPTERRLDAATWRRYFFDDGGRCAFEVGRADNSDGEPSMAVVRSVQSSVSVWICSNEVTLPSGGVKPPLRQTETLRNFNSLRTVFVLR